MTISAPNERISLTTTSPILVGADTDNLSISFITSKILFFGIGWLVFTDTNKSSRLFTLMEVVIVLTGFVNSLIAYCLPRMQKLPVTFISSSTFKRQPLGQIIQVNSFIYLPSNLKVTSPFKLDNLSLDNLTITISLGMRTGFIILAICCPLFSMIK